MAALPCARSAISFRPFMNKLRLAFVRSNASSSSLQTSDDRATHTGQEFSVEDYRRVRFLGQQKWVNDRFAIDFIRDDPVVVCTRRTVSSNSGGPLGHPKVFINLDPPGIHTCGYSGRKFVLKKYYDEKTMGPSITYEEYLQQIGAESDDTGNHH